MEGYFADEVYAILDELNVGIEDIFNEVSDQDKLEIMITKLREKTQEFLSDMEHETEKLDMLEYVA
ncbi:hypothetical protein ACFL50_02150 [Candidatus Latescibacterota bacterium]